MSQTIGDKIVQAKAALRVVSRRFNSGRATEEQLITAQEYVNQLLISEKETSSDEAFTEVLLIEKPVVQYAENTPEVVELLNKAKAIKQEMAILSNQLANADDEKSKSLLINLSQMNKKKEAYWTNYFYFKRNGVFIEDEIPEVYEKTAELLALEAAKKPLSEKRSRARKKLTDVTVQGATRIKYEEIAGKSDMEIKALEEKIKLLKNATVSLENRKY